MANNDKENKIKKFTKEAIGKTLNQFNKEIGMADLVEINKNQDRILNGILSQVNDENTEKIEKSNIITLDNSTDGIVELKEIQGDTNVNVSKIEEMPITHDIGDKEGNVFTLNEIPKGAISIGEIQGNTMVNCNKDDKKELVLMKDLSTQGDNSITIAEGVDGGKVDVALEGNTLVNVSHTKDNYITHEREEDTTGNHIALVDEGYIRPVLNGKTMVNVCDQKDPIAVTKSYTVENSGNHVALEGDVDGSCRPVVTGNTLVNCMNLPYNTNTPNNATLSVEDGYHVVSVTTTGDITYDLTVGELTLLKPSTQYTVICDIAENTLNCVFRTNSKVNCIMSNAGTGTPSNVFAQIGEVGVTKTLVTTNSVETVNRYTIPIKFENAEARSKIKYRMFILEGDYTGKPISDYFSGMQSSFEDKVVPENLSDIPNVETETVIGGKAWTTTNLIPAGEYTFIFTGKTSHPTDKRIQIGVADTPYIDKQSDLGSYLYTYTNINSEYSTYAIKITLSESKYVGIRLVGAGGCFKDVYLVEGDYTNYDFTDYDPTKVGKYRVDYKVTGKNKFVIKETPFLNSGATKLISYSDNSLTASATSTGTWQYVKVPLRNLNPNTDYILSWNVDNSSLYARVYNANTPIDTRYENDISKRQFNTSNYNDLSIRFFITIDPGVIGTVNYTNIQLEEGSTLTEYEPYKESTKTLYLNSPLLEGDTIEQYGNNIAHVHRYGKVVLDGSEAWKISSINDRFPGQYLCYLVYPNVSFVHDTEMSPIMCDKFKVVSPGNTNLSNVSPDSISVSGIESNLSEKAFRLSISESKLSSLDLAGFRKYLLANPITVVYKLVSPQYEVISINDKLLTDSYVNGHLDFESAVPVEKVDFSGTGKTLKYLQSSTSYDIQFNADANGSLDYIVLGDEAIKTNIQVTKGINKINLTTISSTVPFLYFNGIGFNASNIVVTPAIEQDFGYFSGLSSTFEDGVVTQEMIDSGKEVADNLGKYKVEYKVTGKNKWRTDLIESFKIPEGNYNANSGYLFKDLCPDLIEGHQYKVSFSYDRTGYESGTLGIVLVLPYLNISDAYFTYTKDMDDMRVYFYGGNLYNTFTNIQIEEGTEATSYESYKEHIKTLYLNSPLLEGDTIEEKDGGIYHVHRSSCALLDNKIGWSIRQDSEANTIFIESQDLNSSRFQWNSKCIADTIISKNDIDRKDEECIGTNGSIRLRINKSKLSSLDEVGIKAYLKDNPIKACFYLRKPEYELIEQSNLAMPSYANGHLDLTSAVPVSKVNFLHFEEELTYLYPSTSYTVQFISDKAISVDITLGGTELLAQSIVVGLNRIAITTPDTLVDNKLIIDGVGASISNVVVTNTDRKFGYFEGMKSVGECEDLEIVSSNKNLFDLNNEIKFKQGEVYRCDIAKIICPNYDKLYWKPFDENGNILPYTHKFILRIFYPANLISENLVGSATFNDSSYIDISLYKNKEIYIDLYYNGEDLGLNDGEEYTINSILISSEPITNTTYIPHADNTQALIHEPLRAVGDVKDKYVLIDGKWYIERNTKQIEIPNDLGYYISSAEDVYTVFQVSNNMFNGIANCNTGNGNIIVDKYVNKITINGAGVIWIKLPNTIANTVNNLKAYLPMNIVAPLQTPTYEPIDYNPFTVYSGITHISNNSTIPCNMTIKNTGFNCLLKPSTTYTVSSNLGLNTVTTPSKLSEDCLRFYDTDTSTVTTMKNVTVLEGDWTNKADLIPSNFSGIESCFEQELVTDENDANYGKYKVTAKVIGKNLFDGELALGSLNNSTGETSKADLSLRTINFIPVISGSTITVSNDMGYHNYIYEYDGNYKFIKYTGHSSDRGAKTIILNNSTKFIKFRSISGNNENDLNVKYQVEQGDTVTAYEPYKESDVTFYIDKPLRGIEDSKDRIFIQGDKVVVERNCGSVILDGSDDENWWAYNGSPGVFVTQLNNKVIGYNTSRCDNFVNTCNSSPFDINKFKHLTYTDHPTLTTIYFDFGIERRNDNTTEFKQWLQQNPTTVIYQLQTPVYEEVEYSSNRLILNTFNNESFNNSTLFLDTNISPKLSFKPLWEELVYVKNSTKYYIQFNAVGSGEVVINLGGTELITEIVEGYNCIPITTPSESTNLMTIIGQGITINEVVVSEVICGGYYKGLQSCFEEHMENGKYRVLLRGIALDGSKVNGIKLYINEPLRGVNDTKDRLCIKNGKLMVERKCGEIVLDGSNDENWGMQNNTNYLLTLAGAKRIYLKNSGVGISDKLIVKKSSSTEDVYIYPILQDSVDYIRIANGVSKWSNKESFKQWLQQNPITIVYQLAEPVYEEATNEYGLPIVFEGYENGIVYIDSAVTPTTHIKYTSNNQLATTLSEAEEQNIATQEDINMNVVTYMMDIDMILTEMEMSNDTSVMAVRRDSSNENMLDRMSKEDKKVYQDNTVVMLEKMITANVLDKEDIERRVQMYYDKGRISKEQYEYLKSLL